MQGCTLKRAMSVCQRLEPLNKKYVPLICEKAHLILGNFSWSFGLQPF
jgi:hypothetical protein